MREEGREGGTVLYSDSVLYTAIAFKHISFE